MFPGSETKMKRRVPLPLAAWSHCGELFFFFLFHHIGSSRISVVRKSPESSWATRSFEQHRSRQGLASPSAWLGGGSIRSLNPSFSSGSLVMSWLQKPQDNWWFIKSVRQARSLFLWWVFLLVHATFQVLLRLQSALGVVKAVVSQAPHEHLLEGFTLPCNRGTDIMLNTCRPVCFQWSYLSQLFLQPRVTVLQIMEGASQNQ